MTTADFVAELYREYDWRFDEVRRLQNLIIGHADLAARGELRKSLTVVLYAHFEGFCIFALQHYLAAINKARVACGDVAPAVLAGAWERLFNAMEHGDRKAKIFRKALPHDASLHRHWRRRHFIEEMERLLQLRVDLPESIIDAESNLKAEVLKRNLFLLGLDHMFVEMHADELNNLLGRRNRIAHGDDRRPVGEAEYRSYEEMVFEICFHLIAFLEDAHRQRYYEKRAPEYAV
jgi:RiboL-PSP-HEPN